MCNQVGIDGVMDVCQGFKCFAEVVALIELRERLLCLSKLIMYKLMRSDEVLNRLSMAHGER